MIRAHIDADKTVPVWAAIGAPLIGVPLMIVLLAIAAPARPVSPEAEVGTKSEQVEVRAADHQVDPCLGLEQSLQS
jgi:hypothetical protein